MALAGAGCLEATSIFNLFLEALLIQLKGQQQQQAGEPPPLLPPTPLFSFLLLDVCRAIPLFPPPPPGRLLRIGVRLSGRLRLRTLSKGIYIRPNRIKQRLGVFIAHCKKKKRRRRRRRRTKRSGRISRMSRIYTIAVKWRKRNVVFMDRKRQSVGDPTDPVGR